MIMSVLYLFHREAVRQYMSAVRSSSMLLRVPDRNPGLGTYLTMFAVFLWETWVGLLYEYESRDLDPAFAGTRARSTW